jgi:type VI secretion system protein ImpL
MNLATWLRIAAIFVGALALTLLIWFGGPFVAFGEVRPFESFWVRLPIALILMLGALGWIAWIVIKRRKAVAALSEAMAKEESQTGDGAALSAAMRDALATLRRTRGKDGGDYLYDLPWYVIIGPPGAGKTTALINSGLKFPLARGGQTPAAVAGAGGTRYCDWWFAEDAVLIDTAGRYTTQDTDTRAERTSWLGFLDLLKANRPRQPINGVIVAISIEDLLTSSQEEIIAHADAIRARLLELNERLKVDFPVYAVFTKADLIAGFNEFFAALSEPQRRMVWGHTFQTIDKTRNMIGDVPPEFDALIERLNERLSDRLQDEHNPTSRAKLFGLPSQMATLKPLIIDFLGRVFEPTRYQSSATLRGFYFTSGTQEGTPIDQLIGALSRNFGSDHADSGSYSGRGKSFFLTDLIQKVIIGESGWVSTDLRAARRSTLLRIAGFSAIALVSLALGGMWWTSYARNSDLINQTNYGLADYRSSAAPVLQETTLSDRNFSRVLPLLHKLRHMPAGYADKDEPTPVAATFGLSQRERLQSATQESYHQALERLLRSRIIFRLEEQLEANVNNPGFIYEALKVYLMVGGRAPLDRDLVLAWMRQDWAENLFPGAANAKGREALEEHLVALLDLDDGSEPVVKLNQPLIESSQRTLRRLSIAERAYELLRTQGRNAARDWVAAIRGGSDARLVFEGVSGEDLDSIRVPYFYTYDGFQGAFVDRLGDIGERIEKERWVLGDNADQAAITSQYASLFQDLLKLYARDFTASWQKALRRLKLRPLNADKPKYIALSAISAPTSPFKQLLESIRDETQLTKERAAKRPAAAQAAEKMAGQVADKAAKTLEERANYSLSRLGTSLPLSAPGVDRVIAGGGGGEALGANIEAQFKAFHVLVEGDGGKRPVDQALQIFAEINQNPRDGRDHAGTGGGGQRRAGAADRLAARQLLALPGAVRRDDRCCRQRFRGRRHRRDRLAAAPSAGQRGHRPLLQPARQSLSLRQGQHERDRPCRLRPALRAGHRCDGQVHEGAARPLYRQVRPELELAPGQPRRPCPLADDLARVPARQRHPRSLLPDRRQPAELPDGGGADYPLLRRLRRQTRDQRLHGGEPAGRQHADAGDVAGRRPRQDLDHADDRRRRCRQQQCRRHLRWRLLLQQPDACGADRGQDVRPHRRLVVLPPARRRLGTAPRRQRRLHPCRRRPSDRLPVRCRLAEEPAGAAGAA